VKDDRGRKRSFSTAVSPFRSLRAPDVGAIWPDRVREDPLKKSLVVDDDQEMPVNQLL
jgi:hypothetical protein